MDALLIVVDGLLSNLDSGDVKDRVKLAGVVIARAVAKIADMRARHGSRLIGFGLTMRRFELAKLFNDGCCSRSLCRLWCFIDLLDDSQIWF